MWGNIMNLLELGCLLKEERERRKLSLRDVMEATKISRRNLNALETGEVSRLPHPVYLKGYVRNYAQLVGIDPDPLVDVVEQQSDGESGYIAQRVQVASAPASPVAAPPLSAAPQAPPVEPAAAQQPAQDPVESAAKPAEPSSNPTPASPAKPEVGVGKIHYSDRANFSPRPRKSWWPWLALFLSVTVAAVLYVQYRRLQAESVPSAPPAVVEQTPTALAANATTLSNATEAGDNATVAEPVAIAESAPKQEPVAAPVSTPTPSVPSAPIEVTRQTTTIPSAAPVSENRTSGKQSLTFTAKSREVCWVGVYEGQKATTFLLRDGESRQVEFAKGARVRLGNAGGVSVRLNGQDYPFEGARGQKITLEIGAH